MIDAGKFVKDVRPGAKMSKKVVNEKPLVSKLNVLVVAGRVKVVIGVPAARAADNNVGATVWAGAVLFPKPNLRFSIYYKHTLI